jgi:hypothetical protein
MATNSFLPSPQVDARASQSRSGGAYVTPHTLHSYQTAVAAVTADVTADATVVATVQPSVLVVWRQSCRRYVM